MQGGKFMSNLGVAILLTCVITSSQPTATEPIPAPPQPPIVEPIPIPQAPVVVDPTTKKAEYDVVLGSFTTKFNNNSIGRTENLRVACNYINGQIVAPGKVFSFTSLAGPCTTSRGYKSAIIISDGKYTSGIGGGVCQIASTLYNTALLSNMEIKERKCHSLRSSYVEVGRDATISTGSIDLKFKNSYNKPVKISCEFQASKGYVTIKILGLTDTPIPNIKLNVTKTGVSSYKLTRTVNGVTNYTAYSKYLN